MEVGTMRYHNPQIRSLLYNQESQTEKKKEKQENKELFLFLRPLYTKD